MRNKIFHIVTTGGYGYNDVGDEAMPRTLLINLKGRFKDKIRFTMLSPQPDFTEQYHGEKAAPDIGFLSQSVDTMNAERTLILDLAKRYKRHPGWTKLLISRGLSEENKRWYSQCLSLFELLDSADALLNVGGGNLNSIMTSELYKKTTLYEICKIFKKDVFVSGQSLGPFYSDNDKAIARESLSKVDVLTFRDRGFSLKRIRAVGLVEENYNKLPLMYDAGDDAMSMPQEPKEKAARCLERDTPREWRDYDARHIWALNLKASLNSFKGKGRSKGLDAEVDLLGRVSEYILRNYSAKILLVPTDYCEGVDDRVYHKQIADKISPDLQPGIFSMEKVYTDFELKGIIAACDFALGARYHFHVFSLAAKVPSIGIASGEYQQAKLNGVYSLLGLQKYYIEHDMEYAKLEDVTVVVDKLVTRRDEVKKKLDENVGPLVEKSKLIADIIYAKLTTGLIDETYFRDRANAKTAPAKRPAPDDNSTRLGDIGKNEADDEREADENSVTAEPGEHPGPADLPKLKAEPYSKADKAMEVKRPADIKVSVIIPTLNHARSLQLALKSILAQGFPTKDFEILVVDNGSSDDTRAVAGKAIVENPNHRIKYILEPTPGLLSGRHRGANEAEGNILMFVDDDIEAATGWLSAIAGAFDDPSVDLVGGPSLPRYEVGPPNWMAKYLYSRQGKVICGSLSLLDIGNKTIQIDPTFVWGLNFSIRKKTLFKMGGFHPDGVPKNMLHLRGDGETGLALKMRGRRIAAVYNPLALVYHHIPKARLTVRYFEQRHFAQGISDSYTQIREYGGVQNVNLPVQSQAVRMAEGTPFYGRYQEMVHHRIADAYVEGFKFHYNAVEKSHELLDWVLRENYFDYSLPDPPEMQSAPGI